MKKILKRLKKLWIKVISSKRHLRSTAYFPAEGRKRVIYIDDSTDRNYYWNGSRYIFIYPKGGIR